MRIPRAEKSVPVFDSGSFLAGRGHPDPDAQRLKVFMADEITTTIAERKPTRQQLVNLTGLAQPDVSRIVVVENHSIERLLSVMTTPARNVHVLRTDAPNAGGSVLVDIPAPLLDGLREQPMGGEPDVTEQTSTFFI